MSSSSATPETHKHVMNVYFLYIFCLVLVQLSLLLGTNISDYYISDDYISKSQAFLIITHH